MIDAAPQLAGDETANELLAEADAVRNPTTVAGYIKCSLCNNIVNSEVTHITMEHGHLQHIKAMLQVPLTPPSAENSNVALRAVGVYAVSTSRNADRGAEAFQVMQRAHMQLNCLLKGMQSSCGDVYAFGSVVSMGSWDGEGDGDFAFIEPRWFYTPALSAPTVVIEENEDDEDDEGKEDDDGSLAEAPVIDDDASDTTAGEKEGKITSSTTKAEEVDDTSTPQHRWETDEAVSDVEAAAATAEATPAVLNGRVISPEREKRIIRIMTARLRDAGFRFEELEPVLRTRIPVVRRKRLTHDPLSLHAMHLDHLIRVRFECSFSEDTFRRIRLPKLLSTYHAREVPQESQDLRRRQLVLAVPDGCDAVHLMSRRECIAGVQKEWMSRRRTLEVFAVDFDLSCRYHGIRNSWLLRRYMMQDETFRMGNVFLKKWSKSCGINNSRVGFLTSYAISVLWVYFLLRRGVATFVNPDDVPVLPDPTKQLEIPYIPLWPAVDDAESDAARIIRLGTLLRDFFYFYGEEFGWATQVVSIRQPCPSAAEVRTKMDLNWVADDTSSLLLRDRCYHIFSIEDVYEDDLDLGRHLTEEKAAWTRLQFRLAYMRCAGGEGIQLMRLLDVPRKRASDVLRARLFDYLLLDTENAESTVANLFECLCQEDEHFPGEDPTYLLAAYELGNRLSDLWYDTAQIELDVANHKKYDHRANLYTPPEDPRNCGEWGLLCTDPLPEEGMEAGNTDANNNKREMSVRRVRLEPPNATVNGRDPPGVITAQGSPKRQREIQLMKARNQHEEASRQFAAQISKDTQEAVTPNPSVVGLTVSNAVKGSALQRCFYPLQAHRFFSSYDAREIFFQCLEDVAREVTYFYEGKEAEQLDFGICAALTNRQQLFEHLQERLRFTAVALPGYEEVLFFVTVLSNDYLHFRPVKDVPVLFLSPLLLRIIGADGGVWSVPVAPVPDTVKKPPNAHPSAPASAPHVNKVRKDNKKLHDEKLVSAGSPRVKINAKIKEVGTCAECGRRDVEIFPSDKPSKDSGFYCANCWSRY